MLDPLMPINPGCNSQTPADQLTSIVDRFWLQEPQTSFLEPKKRQETHHLFQPHHIVWWLPAISKAGQAEKRQDRARLLQRMGVVGSHASCKCLLTLGGHAWFTSADRKTRFIQHKSIRSQTFTIVERQSSNFSLSVKCDTNVCLTQPAVNLLARQDRDSEN